MRFQSLLADSLRCFSKEYTRSWHLSSKELTRRTIVLWDYRILWLDMSLQQMTSFDEEAFFGNYFSFDILWQQASNLNRITSSIIYWTRARKKKKKSGKKLSKVNVNILRYFPNCESIIWIEASWSRLVSKINVFQTDVH